MAKSKKKPQKQNTSAVFLLLFLIIVLPLVAGFYYSQTYNDSRYGWALAIFWLSVSLFSFIFTIIFLAQSVLPRDKGILWSDGINMLLRSTAQFLPWKPIGYLPPNYPGKEHLPPSFISLRAGILRSHYALAINKNAKFVRADGPGFVSLNYGESVGQILDLRPHFRRMEVTANTRDGIPITLSITVVFRINPAPPNPADINQRYPYDKTAIFQITQAATVDENNEYLLWAEQLAPEAATHLVSEVANYTLSRLTEEPQLLVDIQKRVSGWLNNIFSSMGIKIMGGTVFVIDVPQEITEQRLLNWQAPWEIESQVLDAERDAVILRQMKEARAKAQVEIIGSIMNKIREMQGVQNISLPQVINLRVIEALDEAIATSPFQAHFPGRVLADMAFDTSSRIQPQFSPTGDEPEDGDED